MSARARDLGTRGRVVVTALSVAVASALAGWMAASDHTATTSNTTGATSVSPAGSSTGSFDDQGFSDDDRSTATPGTGSTNTGGSPPVARTGAS